MIYTVLDSDIFFKLIDKSVSDEIEATITTARMLDYKVEVKRQEINKNDAMRRYYENCLTFGDNYALLFDVIHTGYLRHITLLHKGNKIETFNFSQLQQSIARIRELIIEEASSDE